MRVMALIVLLGLALGGCQTVQTAQYSEGVLVDPGLLPEITRTVETFHRDDLFSVAPLCVLVLPINPSMGIAAWQADVMEQAVARHARDVLDRVIEPEALRRGAFNGGYDLTDASGVVRLGQSVACDHVLRILPLHLDATFAGVWSRNRIGLEIIMLSVSELEKPLEAQRALWSARHASQRADGAVPFSPIGVVSGVVAAGSLKADEREVFTSLANTVARRMFATLPDMRTPAFQNHRLTAQR